MDARTRIPVADLEVLDLQVPRTSDSEHQTSHLSIPEHDPDHHRGTDQSID